MRGPHSSFRSAKSYVGASDTALPLVLPSLDGSKRGVIPEKRLEAAAEHSSEDGLGDMSGTQSGGMSSHGSIGAVGQGSSQPQEVEGCRVSDSMDLSTDSLGHTSINTLSVEDADVSSAPLHGSKRGSMLDAQEGGPSRAAGSGGATELPEVAGDTAQEKADNAHAMAEAAMADARAKARFAAELMAAAQQKSVLESRSLKRKRGLGLKSYVGPPSHVLLGVRISVFWPDDHAFYKGRIVEVLDEDDRVMVKYDDEMDEALQLLEERFQWLAPRAQTAGANSELQMEMARLGAEGVAETAQVPDTSGMAMVRAPPGVAAVGGRVSVHFAGVGIWCRGDVLAYDSSLEKHQVLYEDGEHEWVRLSREAHTWWPGCRDTPYPAGLPPGTASPRGQEAIGWRVSIYWPDNNTFYDGEVIGFDNVTGRHHVLYDSGDQEHLTLEAAKTCWVMPPSVSSQAAGSEEASQQSAPKGTPQAANFATSSRSLRRGGSAGHAASAARQSALVREQALNRSGDQLHRKAWLKEDLGGQADGELLPFDGGMLEEGLCAEDFSREIIPGEHLKASAPSWWHQQPHSHSAAMLISPCRARSTQLPSLAEDDEPATWSPADGSPLLPAVGQAARAGQLRTQRSLPDCSTLGLLGLRAGALPLARATTMSMPAADCQLDELICQLDGGAGAISMASPLSAGLGPMDMQLPGLDLGSACVPSLLLPEPDAARQGSSLVASSSAPLLGGSAHGSAEFQSHLAGAAKDILAGTPPPDVADVAQFLCGDEEDARLLMETSGSLGSARGSARSMVSDSSVVHLGLPSCQPPLPGSAISASTTPESARRLLQWDVVRKQQGLVLEEPLQEPPHGSSALVAMAPEPLDASVHLSLSAGTTDGLAMANELQTLLAEMDWG